MTAENVQIIQNKGVESAIKGQIGRKTFFLRKNFDFCHPFHFRWEMVLG